ncbi:MAG: hypothetical protein ABJA77_04105 [Variovorax sp.]
MARASLTTGRMIRAQAASAQPSRFSMSARKAPCSVLKPALAAGRVASIAGPSAASQQQRLAGQEVEHLSYKHATTNIRELKHQWEIFTFGENMTRMLVALAAWWARQREPGLAATEILHAVQRSKTIIAELQPLPGSGHKPFDCVVSEG